METYQSTKGKYETAETVRTNVYTYLNYLHEHIITDDENAINAVKILREYFDMIDSENFDE